jgi:hypothetical protein
VAATGVTEQRSVYSIPRCFSNRVHVPEVLSWNGWLLQETETQMSAVDAGKRFAVML